MASLSASARLASQALDTLPRAGLLDFLDSAVPSQAPFFSMQPAASQLTSQPALQPPTSASGLSSLQPSPATADKATEPASKAAEPSGPPAEAQPVSGLPKFQFGVHPASLGQPAAARDGAGKRKAAAAAAAFGFEPAQVGVRSRLSS